MKRVKWLCIVVCVISLTYAYQQSKEQMVLNSKFEGQWSTIGDKISGTSPFSKFSVNHGVALIYFTDSESDNQKIGGVIIQVLAPEYYDQFMVKLVIQFKKTLNTEEIQWEQTSKVKYQIFDQTIKVEEGSASYYYQIDEDTISISNNDEHLTMVIPYERLFINPRTTLVFTMISFVIYLGVRRKKIISDEPIIRHQIMPIILGITLRFLISVVQFIIGLKSLFGNMDPEAFFIVCGFFNLSSCFHLIRYYHPKLFQKKILIVVSWITVILYTWMLLYFKHSYIFLMINSFIFIPEIFFHALKGQKVTLDVRHILFNLSNQIYILYFKVCPKNMFRQSPNFVLGYCIGGIILFQLFLVLGQIYISPRFFLPSIFFPRKHDYYNQSQITKNLHLKISQQCYICLQVMNFNKKNKIKLMITPCSHVFHADCLKNWMAVKMQCPLDRKPLPSF